MRIGNTNAGYYLKLQQYPNMYDISEETTEACNITVAGPAEASRHRSGKLLIIHLRFSWPFIP